MTRRLTEQWVLLVEGDPAVDPATGNSRPGPDREVPWSGLLQQRQLSASSVDAGNSEFLEGHETSVYDLLLDPGLDPFPKRRDTFRGPDGRVFQVVGTPRVRRPARGSRRPAYIAAIVRAASDFQEEP
ncbi:hypothetical protein DW322_11265 [Rhodococcus rhodnii]|uniref:Uncharacterized protein n=2 Tax=Rhodococcus rhodnii TaxID=38312 RepID=R7WV87_9NOCA|nr:hypothetical protein [Rhodococcus rhodnii]EOM78064.1 hypothetical protein Rrhod_0605 [Rhodococcus rhodnii LMG 5362]TXG90690.1 hypothetical protein DW322_11265 [Rhodococcus rhodnii]